MKEIVRNGSMTEQWNINHDSVTLQQKQDVTHLLERNKKMRNAESSWRKFDSKEMYTPVAVIPNIVICDLMDKGIDFYNTPTHEIEKIIDRDYPLLKTTNARLT